MANPRELLEATLPSGKKIVLRELDGNVELICAKECGENQSLMFYSQVMRSIVSIDGEPLDSSKYTPQSTRDLFSSVEWQLVLDAFGLLNRPRIEEVEAFRATFRRSVDGDGGQPALAAAAGDAPAPGA